MNKVRKNFTTTKGIGNHMCLRKIESRKLDPFSGKIREKSDFLFGKNSNVIVFLANLSVVANIESYQLALPNMTEDDATKLTQLMEEFNGVNTIEDHEDGNVRELGVCGNIDRLLKEIIARESS
jgi:hypothetical protein